MSDERDLDIQLFGATSFVGRLTAAYLARAAPPGVRIGLAGRSRERLEAVRDDLGEAAADWPLTVADSSDRAAMGELARSARVVVSTVGPYRQYGLPLVEACAEAGTHYADLTGEVLFMRETIDRFDETAKASGAKIVHSCGFDSIPSDLGVHALHEAAKADGAGELEETTLMVRRMHGGFSGGTLASMKDGLDEARRNRESRRIMGDPYALSPDREAEPDLGDEGDLRGVELHENPETWLGPFVMAQINTRVVRRSNALQDWAYGRRMRYREVMSFGPGVTARAKAAAVAAGAGALVAGLSFGPTRAVLDRVLPAPGDGPSEAARERGSFHIQIRARTSSGARYVADVEAQGDPGYAATAVMLGEAGLCLAGDGDRLPDRAGVLTPATAMGGVLAERLRAAGQRLEVRRG
jgi:short subunit dehydrogenase-like uncharacterized protein